MESLQLMESLQPVTWQQVKTTNQPLMYWQTKYAQPRKRSGKQE
jgi:hypothetical protein